MDLNKKFISIEDIKAREGGVSRQSTPTPTARRVIVVHLDRVLHFQGSGVTSHEVIEQHAYRHDLKHALRGIVAQFYILGQGQITSGHARKLFSTLH